MLPAGTVTFLFSDIEGSTRLLSSLGDDQYEVVLEAHRRLLREAFARCAGQVVNFEGDACFAVFVRAQDAVRAAIEAQRALHGHPWLDGHRVHVRIGLHTCEARVVQDDYVGIGVHRAARICSAAHGGQVVISQSTHDLLAEKTSLECIELGEHGLKDLEQPQRLFQVVHPDLRRTFPPLRSLRGRATNLVAQSTTLVGREDDLRALCEIVRQPGVRLVTLTGPGGAGKTRLALEAASELLGDFENGVFFVALASIRQPDLILPAIAQTLGLSEGAGQTLSAYLAPKHMLLVLDNLEQVVQGAPRVAELLASAAQVRALVTSRAPLRVASERVFPVSALALPEPNDQADVGTVAKCPSVRLFVERARAADPTFELTTGNVGSVAQLCARLDGLPLALELAAARVPLLSPEAMVRRLGARLRLLTGGSRDLPARQQALRDTIAWSVDLLNASERALFAKLAVFSGGFTLDAVEAVCEVELDALASLVEGSLVRRDGERYRMLETIREFAADCLASSGDAEVGGRHANYFAALAERVHLRRRHHEKESLEAIECEHDNLRSALDWLGQHDPAGELRLAGALGWFWHLHSHFTEGRARLADALVRSIGPEDARARALAAAGELAAWAGDVEHARSLIDEAVNLWRARDEAQEIAGALVELGWGWVNAGDDTAARRCMEEALVLRQESGDPLLINRARIGLLQVLVSLGELDAVESMVGEALHVAERLSDLRSMHFAHHFQADVALIRGECELAEPRYQRALELAVELGDRSETAVEMQGVAMAAAGRGRPERALRLAGAAAAEFDALAIDLSGIRFWSALLERYLGGARSDLGAAAAAAWDAGRRTAFGAAVAEALAADTAR